MGNDLIYLASASSQTEAGVLRAYLEAHGVPAHIQGEHHSAMLGPLGAFAIELRLLVPERDFERARDLLEAFFAAEPIDEDADVGDVERAPEGNEQAFAPPTVSPARAGALAIVPGLGLGHTVTGAPGHGLALLTLEIVGIVWIATGDLVPGLAAALGAVALDFFGATRRARDRARAAVPAARLHVDPRH